MKEKEHNDFTACTVWLTLPNGHYLLDYLYERLRFTELKKAVLMIQEKWNVMNHLIEDAASGTPLTQELQDSTQLNIIPITPKGSKYDRIKAISPMVRGGNVHLPAEFNTYQGQLMRTPTKKAKQFIEMFALWPFVDHDDLEDSTAQYLNYINKGINTVKYADLKNMFPDRQKRSYEVF
jgi:predicted phage terminase large subunit-like protein